jgi:hypothetical protein
MLAPTHFTRRTCKMARRSMGLQFAIHFRARHTHPQCRTPSDSGPRLTSPPAGITIGFT